jgi:chaperonin cofactor prefoldin
MQVPAEQQAFLQEMMEVEKEMNQANQQARICEAEAFALKRNIRKNELAINDIEKSKDSKAIYLPLGKAFICRKP